MARAVRNAARENAVNTDYLVWAPKKELIGRLIYEIGRTPRRDIATYQRMCSAASRLDAGMVDWGAALAGARLFHTSGITLGLAAHSGYDRNYNLAAFNEALAAKPASCLVGLDFNYRSTLWSRAEARDILTPIITERVDMLVTTIEDMAQIVRNRMRGPACGGDRQGSRSRCSVTTISAVFLQRTSQSLRPTVCSHYRALPGFFRAASLGVGGKRQVRQLLPLAGSTVDHPSGPPRWGRDVEGRDLTTAC